MRTGPVVFTVLILVIVTVFFVISRFGIPMQALPPGNGALLGSVNAVAIDTSRPDLFSGAVQRVVPFQMLYPAKTAGTFASYVPDAGR